MTLELTAIILAALLSLFFLRKHFYSLFFVALLTSEFFYIQIGAGVARPYHFMAVLILLMMARYIPVLFRSKVFIALLVFFGVNVCAIILSDKPDLAGASFLSFCANLAVAMATALILLTKKISLETFKKLLLTVTLISVAWGVVQISIYSLFGINLALSPEQVPQIQVGLAPAFRTEANTFGKYMVFPFLLLLPEYLEYKTIKHINLIFIVFFIGIMMNFTRTSIYGIGVATFFILLWYGQKNKLRAITSKWLAIIMLISTGVFFVLSGVVNVSEYNVHKLNTLLSQDEIIAGGSSGYRVEMMRLVVTSAISDTKKIIIGNGWGQTHVYYNDIMVQAGGGDLINVLGYAGLLGVVTYLVYMLMAFLSVRTRAMSYQDITISRFAEGCLFALLGIFFTGQMAGYLIAPEYWMLIGISIFLSLFKPEICFETA